MDAQKYVVTTLMYSYSVSPKVWAVTRETTTDELVCLNYRIKIAVGGLSSVDCLAVTNSVRLKSKPVSHLAAVVLAKYQFCENLGP